MSKIITSPISRWAGTVTLADPLTLPQAQAIEKAMDQKIEEGEKRLIITLIDEYRQPAILTCVEKWDLQNFTLTANGTLPASPRGDSHKLCEWIFSELAEIYFGEALIPNESSPMPTTTPAPDITPPK